MSSTDIDKCLDRTLYDVINQGQAWCYSPRPQVCARVCCRVRVPAERTLAQEVRALPGVIGNPCCALSSHLPTSYVSAVVTSTLVCTTLTSSAWTIELNPSVTYMYSLLGLLRFADSVIRRDDHRRWSLIQGLDRGGPPAACTGHQLLSRLTIRMVIKPRPRDRKEADSLKQWVERQACNYWTLVSAACRNWSDQ
ncbi:hypothetical protein RRG08_031088 [Elysia crispata]|uniref:Uncharacterized protein n=1 Tax=Elysia crispata TaxID=231223 RepID=A0AAE0ZGF3_9GAST|nr:hypothetical protein RRG08_031088 [Elysia crispata]